MDAPPHQTLPNLPLSLSKENFQQIVQPSPYKPAESLLLGGTGEPSLLMGDLSASFMPETSSQPASMFADFNIPELLMDEFFTFNPSAMHHVAQQQQQQQQQQHQQQQQQQHQQQQPQPQQTPQELQEQSIVLEDAKSSVESLASGSNKSKKRHKRPRNSFNELQKKILDDFFDYQSHTPTRAQKLLLANKVNSNERTVTVWFQNRRQKLVKLARGDDVSSPGETKPVSLKTHKQVSGGVSKKTKKSHYLSPPMLPTEAPAMGNGFGASPSTPFIMIPNTPTNPNMYAMFNGSFDASRYMLSPVTPTFNTYAMLQQMRNMQLTTPSPPPPQQPQDMFMDFQNNPLMFHPNPTPDQFLNFPQTYLPNNNNNNPTLPQMLQDPLLLSKTSFVMPPQNASLPIDPSLTNLTAASLQDKVKNSTSI